jgi:hypothetical protein
MKKKKSFPETKRFKQLIGLVEKTSKFKEGKLINPTELAKEIGTSPAWAARALMALGWEDSWRIGPVRSPRKYYSKEEDW